MSDPVRRTARIVVIGNEILSGKLSDANSPFLLRRLRAAGVRCLGVVVIPDEVPAIARAIREAAGAADLVFSSGGVGPTHDDKTMEGIAAAFGVSLREHAALAGFLRTKWGGDRVPARMRMALLPHGAEVDFAAGLPLIRVRNVYAFPGVPALLQRQFAALEPELLGPRPACVAVFTGQRESEIADFLERLQQASPGVEIGSYPRYDAADWKVMLTLEGDDGSRVRAAAESLLQGLDPARTLGVDWDYRPEESP